MLSKNELIGKIETLAVELLRGVDACSEDNQSALALVMGNAADGLLALLDMLAGTPAGASCGEAAPA